MKRAQIAAPCTAKWEEMTGDEKTRFCAQCKLNVHNAIEMTDEEVMLKIMSIAHGNRVCMRIYRRTDGTFMTKNCPVGVRRLQERARRAAAWLAGGLSVLVSLAANAQTAATKGKCENSAKKPVWHTKVTADATSTTVKSNSTPAVVPSVGHSQLPPGVAGGLSAPSYSDADIKATEEAIQKDEKSKGVDNLQVAHKVQELAMMYYWQQKYAQSEAAYTKAMGIYEKNKNIEGLRICCYQLVMVSGAKGDKKAAAAWKARSEAYAKQIEKPMQGKP